MLRWNSAETSEQFDAIITNIHLIKNELKLRIRFYIRSEAFILFYYFICFPVVLNRNVEFCLSFMNISVPELKVKAYFN